MMCTYAVGVVFCLWKVQIAVFRTRGRTDIATQDRDAGPREHCDRTIVGLAMNCSLLCRMCTNAG